MSKAALMKLEGVNVDHFHALLQRRKKTRYTVDEVVVLLETNTNCLPEEWPALAQKEWLREVARAVVQTAEIVISDDGSAARTARLFYSIQHRERIANNKVKVTTQYVRYDGMQMEEWTRTITEETDAIRRAQRDVNATVMLRNREGASHGWEQMELPYPEVEG